MKISISSLNRAASVQSLRQLFVPFGDVLSASLVLDRSTGRSRGIGHVVMREQSNGERAIAALNNTSFMSHSIVVREVAESVDTSFGRSL